MKRKSLLFWVIGFSALLCWCGQGVQNSVDSESEVVSGMNWTLSIEVNTWSLSSENKVMKEVVNSWDLIVVDYVWKLLDWTVFDTSIESVAKEAWKYNPNRDYTAWLEFTAGAGQMIKGFDEAVIWMKVWESKSVEIPAEKAYWERSEEYVLHIPLEQAWDISGAEVGMQVFLNWYIPATIVDINDSEIVYDANHELAGKTLVFDITIKSIE
jgi:FKBP-type peptidyl-prolyl cis-trans isomerase 2